METPQQIRDRIVGAVAGLQVECLPNGAPAGVPSLLVGRSCFREVAIFLRDDPQLRLDYCSNVTGVDWPERTEKFKVRRQVGEVEKDVEESRVIPGCLEVVYHLYSMSLKHGPLVIRVRTGDRSADVSVPSLTPVWRACELQEREVFDLFGVRFDGHPDLRRILMWDGFVDHPMRRDYVEPDDYDYEPTPHDQVLDRALARAKPGEAGCGSGAR